mgnify:CR=1 FL=1
MEDQYEFQLKRVKRLEKLLAFEKDEHLSSLRSQLEDMR